MTREDARRESRQANSPGALEGPAAFNPLYAELKSKQAEVRRRSAAMASRIATGEGLLSGELARSGRIAASESTLSELSRDYEVNRDLYQDLLKRRENARVSMNLDAEQRGLSFRIQEPAVMPLRPSGLRLLHVAGAGLALAGVVPLLFLFGVLKLDPRVRMVRQIEREAGLPVLGTVPHLLTRRRPRAVDSTGGDGLPAVSLCTHCLWRGADNEAGARAMNKPRHSTATESATVDQLGERRAAARSISRVAGALALTPAQSEDRSLIHREVARPEVDAFRELRTRLLAACDGNFVTLVAPVSRAAAAASSRATSQRHSRSTRPSTRC